MYIYSLFRKYHVKERYFLNGQLRVWESILRKRKEATSNKKKISKKSSGKKNSKR